MPFLKLIRFPNLLIIIFTQWAVFTFLDSNECLYLNYTLDFFLVIAATLFLTAAGYLINDYFDQKIDLINKPERMVVDKYISRRWVLFWHSLFNFLGIVCAFMVSLSFGILTIVISFLLWQYSARYKRVMFVGNLYVALLMGLTLVVVVYADEDTLFDWLLFYAFFAFITGLIREIVKDIEDTEGDAADDCKTLPIVIGFYKTKRFLYYLIISALIVLLFACGYLFFKHYLILPLYLILTTAIPMIIFLKKMIKADQKKDFSVLSGMIKLIMIAGILSMALRCLP